MKKLLAFALCLFSILSSYAKKDDDPESYRVRVTKTDGTTFEGYNDTHFINYLRPNVTTLSVSETFGGEPVKYKSSEIKRVEFLKLTGDSVPLIYEAVMAQKRLPNLLSKNPKPYKDPVFLRLIYDGENVKGYVRPVADYTRTPSMTVAQYTWVYYYLTKDSDIAKAYWVDVNDLIPSMRKVMKFYFREFPELVRMVEDKEITPREFRDHPAMVLPIMDATYQPKE